MHENEMIGRLMELEKYKFVDPKLVAEIVRDVYKVQEIEDIPPISRREKS